jgi:tetratricopeptide (TPR) repeat protein
MSFRYHRASRDASWLGDFEYSTDEISGSDAGDPSATVVVARPQMKAAVVDDAGMLAASVEMGASRLDIAGETVDNPALALAIRRIDAGIYRRVEKQLTEAAEKGYAQEAAEAAMAQLMAEVLPALLARSPEIELTQLGARTKDGAFELKGKVRYVGKGDIAGFDPKADLEADATARIPVALVSRLAELGAVPGPDAEELDAETKKAIAESVKQAISQQIEMLVQSGLAVREGDGVLVSRFELKGGKMTLNGNPADELLSAAALAFGGEESSESGEALNTWTAPDADAGAADGSQAAVAGRLFDQIMAAPDDDLETVERLYLEVIEKAPDTDEAQESHWRLATLYLQAYDEPKYPQARAILEQFLARYPESEGVEVVKPALGFVYEELEDWPAAAATYGEFVESADGAPEVIAEFGYAYAKALQNAGRKDDAAVWYRRFLEVVSDPDDQRVHKAKEALGQP